MITVRVDLRSLKIKRTTLQIERLLDRVMDKVASEGERVAKEHAPVETGRLRNSLHVERGPERFDRRLTTPVEYAIYQEFGTRYHGAQPFMAPAAVHMFSVAERVARAVFR